MRVNKQKAIIFIVSILIAMGCVFFQYKYFSKMVEKEPNVKVYVAGKDLKKGDLLDVKEKAIPKSAYTKDMVQVKEDIGGYVSCNISKGSYIFKSMVYNSEPPVVKEGHRRVTIPVGLVSSVGGSIREGDKVDIGCIFKDGGGKIVLKKVQIHEIINSKGRRTVEQGEVENVEEGVPSAVTLILTPEQCVKIKGCEYGGKLFLIGY